MTTTTLIATLNSNALWVLLAFVGTALVGGIIYKIRSSTKTNSEPEEVRKEKSVKETWDTLLRYYCLRYREFEETVDYVLELEEWMCDHSNDPYHFKMMLEEVRSFCGRNRNIDRIKRALLRVTNSHADMMRFCEEMQGDWQFMREVYAKWLGLISTTDEMLAFSVHNRNRCAGVPWTDFFRKWISLAETPEQMSRIPGHLNDNVLLAVKEEKWNRLAVEAFKAATSALAIIDLWYVAPPSLQEASFASYPGWQNDEGLKLSRIKRFSAELKKESAAHTDASLKWLHLSGQVIERMTVSEEFRNNVKDIHPDGAARHLHKWNEVTLAEVANATTVETVRRIVCISPENSEARAAGFEKWNTLSLDAIAQAIVFEDVLNAARFAQDGSTSRQQGVTKCTELAVNEEQIRQVWDIASEGERLVLTRKLAGLIG